VSGWRALAALAAVGAIAATACKRESREFRDLTPPPASVTAAKYEQNAYATSEGKRLFTWFNCVGCHAHGGGGMGPALMDDRWIYGVEPENVYQTIAQGRPNGMPSFRDKATDDQIWQLVAYVRSMSGQLRKDVSPSRDDHMQAKPAEESTTEEKPKASSLPQASKQ